MAKAEMKATRKDRTESPFAPMTPFDVEAMAKAHADAVKAVVETNTKFFQASTATSAEIVDFINRRLERDVEIGECLADCRSIDEAYTVYADFVQTSVSDYVSEMQRLMTIGEDVLNDTAKTFRGADDLGPTSAKS